MSGKENDKKTITPTPGKKRGRKLYTIETGREISHEEIVLGLIKRTAVTLANAEQCACGNPIEKPKKGRTPARCVLCKAEKYREKSRKYNQRVGRSKGQSPGKRERGQKGVAPTIATYTRHAEQKRQRESQRKAERRAAGLCQLCGKAPATSRCDDCKAKRKAYTERRRSDSVPSNRIT